MAVSVQDVTVTAVPPRVTLPPVPNPVPSTRIAVGPVVGTARIAPPRSVSGLAGPYSVPYGSDPAYVIVGAVTCTTARRPVLAPCGVSTSGSGPDAPVGTLMPLMWVPPAVAV